MKHISIIASIILLSTVILSAQETFIIHKQGTHTYNKPKDLLIKPGGNMIFLFLSQPTGSSDIFSNHIFEVAPNGTIVDSTTFIDETHKWTELNHLYFLEDTLYAFGSGCYAESPDEAFLFLLIFDQEFNIIESKRYTPGLEGFLGTSNGELKYFNDKFYYCAAARSQSTDAPFMAIISRNGDLINFEIETSFPNGLFAPFDFTLQNNLEGYKVFAGPIIPGSPYFGGIIGYFDEKFSLIDYNVLPNNMYLHMTYQPVNDTIFYISGEWNNISFANGKRAAIYKLLNDTTIISEYLHSTNPDSTACPAYRHSLEILPDDNLIFCFTDNIEIEVLPQIYPAKINLMKLTPEMDIIWHRYIGDEKAKWDAFEMHVNEAEEIIIHAAYNIADISQLLNRDVLFIKTTPDGLITGTHDEFPEISSTETLLYPNPAQDFAIVEFSRAYQCVTLVISNISGQEVFRTNLTGNKKQVDISGVPAGNYVYRIFNQEGLDESGKLLVGR